MRDVGFLGAGIGKVDDKLVERQRSWPQTARRHPAINGFVLLLLAESAKTDERIETLIWPTTEQFRVSAFKNLHEWTLQKKLNLKKNEKCTTGLSAGRNCGEPVAET